ncbi:MAG: DUF4136 domain-containing protein [Betaproteobacteria bacterium]
MNGARAWAFAASVSAQWLRRMGWFSLAAACLLLCACASTRSIDSEVRSFGATPAPDRAKLAYRFERLPSQQGSEGAAQDRLEAMAADPLAQRGLVADAQNAGLTVHLSARVEAVERSATFGVPGMVRTPVMWARGWEADRMLKGPFFPGLLEPPWYRYTVSVLVRDASSAEVVFEGHAQHTGPWSDVAQVLPAVVHAAVRDYPNPTPEPHTLWLELGPDGPLERP